MMIKVDNLLNTARRIPLINPKNIVRYFHLEFVARYLRVGGEPNIIAQKRPLNVRHPRAGGDPWAVQIAIILWIPVSTGMTPSY